MRMDAVQLTEQNIWEVYKNIHRCEPYISPTNTVTGLRIVTDPDRPVAEFGQWIIRRIPKDKEHYEVLSSTEYKAQCEPLQTIWEPIQLRPGLAEVTHG
jgi:hypothetical protein